MSEEYDSLVLRNRTVTETLSKVSELGQDNKDDTENRTTDSKKGSKDNLDESSLPLLDNEEKGENTPDKEVVEMELDDTEKKDESSEKKVNEKKAKAKKMKEPVVSCIDTHAGSLSMGVRDEKGVNTEINLDFDDVLAEPISSHGFDPVWRLSFIVFTKTKLWTYRILSALLALPLSILWALIFSVLTALYIWILRPILRIMETLLSIFRRFWIILLGATLAPLCEAIGGIFRGGVNRLVLSA